jgi:hypothetical protein|tara:strand:- start:7483 stop:8094 length:612 start_codon:yes stop_codon:yes gene_type:complete
MICYAVVDDYQKDASYAMKFKSVEEAKGSGFIDKYTPVLRELKDVFSAYDEDELIGIHCLLSFPKVVKYRSSQTVYKKDLAKVVWETIVTKAKPYRKGAMSITDLEEIRKQAGPKAPTKPSQTGVKRPRLYGRDDRIQIISDTIPIRPGTKKYKIWSYIQKGITVAEFIAAVKEANLPGSAKDLQLAEKAGYIIVHRAAPASS